MCGFEQVQCGQDQFDWVRRSGSTPSSGTGPSAGHGGTGKFAELKLSLSASNSDVEARSNVKVREISLLFSKALLLLQESNASPFLVA